MDDAEELRARIEAKVAARRSEVPPPRRERTRRHTRDDDPTPEDQDEPVPFKDQPVPRSLEPARPWLAAEGDLGPDEDDEPGTDDRPRTDGEPEAAGSEPAAGEPDSAIGSRALQPIRPWLFQSPTRSLDAPEPAAPSEPPATVAEPVVPRVLDPARPWTRPDVPDRERSLTAPANAASVLRPLAEELAAAGQDAAPVARRRVFGRRTPHVSPGVAIDADEPIADEPIADEPIADEPIADEPIADEPIAVPERGSRRSRRRNPSESPMARHAVPPGQTPPTTIESITAHEPEPADWAAVLAADSPLAHREESAARLELEVLPADRSDPVAAAVSDPDDADGEAPTGRLRRTVGWLFEQGPEREAVPTLIPGDELPSERVEQPIVQPLAEPAEANSAASVPAPPGDAEQVPTRAGADLARRLAALHDPGYDPHAETNSAIDELAPGGADAADSAVAALNQTAPIGDLRPTLDWSQLRRQGPPSPGDQQPEQPDQSEPEPQPEAIQPEAIEPESEPQAAVIEPVLLPAVPPHRVRPRPYASAPIIDEPFQPKADRAADEETATSTAQTRGSWLARQQSSSDPAIGEHADEAAAEKLDKTGSEQTRRWVRTGVRIGVVLAIIVGAVIALRLFVVAPYYIPSASMEPTLHGCPGCNNDHVLVDKLSYRMHAIHRGDVVVFNRPSTWGVSENVLIKRVVGLPGDTLSIRNGHLLVNGLQLNEPYVNPACPALTSLGEAPHKATTVIASIPPDTVFVMGDNRCDSTDSRAYGVVPDSNVIGRAFLIIWPLNRLHFL